MTTPKGERERNTHQVVKDVDLSGAVNVQIFQAVDSSVPDETAVDLLEPVICFAVGGGCEQGDREQDPDHLQPHQTNPLVPELNHQSLAPE